MKTAIYPGSFDPVTNGHLDIITRASKMFDKLVVVVLINPFKTFAFTMPERCELLRRATAHLPNVEIASYDGLLADYFNTREDIDVLVKGLRATTDFESEFQQAHTNKDLSVHPRKPEHHLHLIQHGEAGGNVRRRCKQISPRVHPRGDKTEAQQRIHRGAQGCGKEVRTTTERTFNYGIQPDGTYHHA